MSDPVWLALDPGLIITLGKAAVSGISGSKGVCLKTHVPVE